MRNPRQPRGPRTTWWKTAIGLVLTALMLFPVYWMINESLTRDRENSSTACGSPGTVAHHDERRACYHRGRGAHAGIGAAGHRPAAGPDRRRRIVRGAGLGLGPGVRPLRRNLAASAVVLG